MMKKWEPWMSPRYTRFRVTNVRGTTGVDCTPTCNSLYIHTSVSLCLSFILSFSISPCLYHCLTDSHFPPLSPSLPLSLTVIISLIMSTVNLTGLVLKEISIISRLSYY